MKNSTGGATSSSVFVIFVDAMKDTIFTRSVSLLILALLLTASCNRDKKQSNGPIVLGDSTTMVTETDPQYLTDYVDDIQLRTINYDSTNPIKENIAAAPSDSTQQKNSTAPAGKGLEAAFKGVTIFIPGIEARSLRQQNLENASGASYQLTGGDLNGKELRISGGATVTEVSQRYMTIVLAKTELGTLQLDRLDNLTDWKALSGGNNVYTISGLDANNLEYEKATPGQIRDAVERAARNKRFSRANIRRWVHEVQNVRSVTQSPLRVVLRSVMWKVEGQDANGKPFHKQVRIDIPI
jgi:hypothetical protein